MHEAFVYMEQYIRHLKHLMAVQPVVQDPVVAARPAV